jgi:hypothetical protein
LNDRKRLLIMLPVLAVAAWLAIFGDKSPGGGQVSEAVAPRRTADVSATVGGSPRPAGGKVSAAASAPVGVRQDMQLALNETSSPNLFGTNAPPPPPEATAPPPPPPPPLPNFRVIGSMNKDGRLNVFLDKDGQTYVATPGAVLDGNRVDVVEPNQVLLFNLSTQITQIIPIEGDK